MTTDLDEQVQDIQDRAAETLSDDTVFQGIVSAGTLQQFVDTLTPLVAEGKLHVDDDGMRTSVVDPANVATYMPVELSPDAFESYDCPGQVVVGVDWGTLDDRLAQANSDDLVSLSVDMETRKLVAHYRNIEQTIALIDPDSVRQEPDRPDLDLPNKVVLEGRDFDTAIKACDETGDHITIEGRPDEKDVRIVAEGDTDDTVVTYGRGDTIDAKVTERTETILSLEYLKEFASPMPKNAEVELWFGDEFPITIDYEACDGDLTVHAMQAPRINSQ